jgi:hypothetical protein
MLRCLRLLHNAAMSCSRRIVLPSNRLATIRTYGRTGELTSVDSSSTKPSKLNVTGPHNISGDTSMGVDASMDGDASTSGDASINRATFIEGNSSIAVRGCAVAPSTVASSVVSSGDSAPGVTTANWQDGARGVGRVVSTRASWAALRRAAVLSFFLFALPCAV